MNTKNKDPDLSRKVTILYSSRTLDNFTEKLLNKGLQEQNFKEGIKTLGEDFSIDKLVETIHTTYKSKRVFEILLHKKMFGNFVIQTDEEIHELRTYDNESSKILASGFNLMFNLALSELYFLTNSFSKNVSTEVKDITKCTIKRIIDYQTEIQYNEEKHIFEKKSNGEEIDRPIHIPFKEVYNQKNNNVKTAPNMTATEGSVLALYEAFAHKYKRFKNHVALLSTAIIAEQENSAKGADTALMKIYGMKETLSDVKPNRLSIRYHATRDLIQSFSKIEVGYELLEKLIDTDIKARIPDITRNIGMTRWEKLKFEYISIIGYGKRGKVLSDIAWWNGATTFAFMLPGAASRAFSAPKILEFIDAIPVLKEAHNLFTNEFYGLFAMGTILAGFNKIPTLMLEREYEKTRKTIYI